MLMQNLKVQLIGPPVTIGWATTSGVEEWALGFSCHVCVSDVIE